MAINEPTSLIDTSDIEVSKEDAKARDRESPDLVVPKVHGAANSTPLQPPFGEVKKDLQRNIQLAQLQMPDTSPGVKSAPRVSTNARRGTSEISYSGKKLVVYRINSGGVRFQASDGRGIYQVGFSSQEDLAIKFGKIFDSTFGSGRPGMLKEFNQIYQDLKLKPGGVTSPSLNSLWANNTSSNTSSTPVFKPRLAQVVNKTSPANQRRPVRPHTKYIILHTTEAGNSSVNKLHRTGEANFVVDTNGKVHGLIDAHRIATHAGRSIWNGDNNIDNYSVGIEIVGFHDRPINAKQEKALKALISDLQSTYGVDDKDVLPHSMVAYSKNRWYNFQNARGRKRCAMHFADPELRSRIGLTNGPLEDPDLVAGRVITGDDRELRGILFGSSKEARRQAFLDLARKDNVVSSERTAWLIAKDSYNLPTTTYVFPDKSRLRGDQIDDWGALPEGTVVLGANPESGKSQVSFNEVGKDGQSAQQIAGDELASSNTIYFYPSGLVRRGDQLSSGQLNSVPDGTKILIGYTYGGHINSDRLPVSIAGPSWNFPSTFYREPDGNVLSGAQIDESKIKPGTLIFFRE